MCKYPNNAGRMLAERPASTDTPCVIRTHTGVQTRADVANIYISVAKLLNFRPKSVYDKRGLTSSIISKYFFSFFLYKIFYQRNSRKIDARRSRIESDACQEKVLNSKKGQTDIQWRTMNFVRGGGVQQIQLRTEDTENGDLGEVAP